MRDIAHPGTDYRVDVPAALTVHADRDRIGQLISNARHHGVPNQPIEVRLRPTRESVSTLPLTRPATPTL